VEVVLVWTRVVLLAVTAALLAVVVAIAVMTDGSTST
jgi:hypothetical protein